MEGSVPTYCIPLAEHCKTHITTVKHTTPAINTFKFQGSSLGWRNGGEMAWWVRAPAALFRSQHQHGRSQPPGTHMVYMHAGRQTYTIKTNESFYKIKTVLRLTFSVIFNQNKYKLYKTQIVFSKLFFKV